MSDINWHEDMENCPNDVDIVTKYHDGTVSFTEAHNNDTDYRRYFPRPKGETRQAGVLYPVAWAVVE